MSVIERVFFVMLVAGMIGGIMMVLATLGSAQQWGA